MTGNSNEILNNTEIGSFKSPEELAQALDTKNKTLAERVRAISKKAIETNSKDLRESLKSELNAKEQEEIREALPDTGVEKVLDKTNGDELTQNAIGDIIGKENAKSLKKAESFFDKMNTGFDKLGDIFEQKGFMAGLGALLIMFKGLFTGDFSKLDEILNPEKKTKLEKVKEAGVETKYILGVKFLLGISNEETSIGYDIMMQKNIREKSFNELNIANLNEKNINGLGEKYGLPGKDRDVFETLNTLKKKEKYIDKIIGKEKADWRDLSLEELISEFNKYIKPIEKLKDLSLDELKEGKFNVFSLDFNNEDGNGKGTLNELLHHRLKDNNSKLKGVNKLFLEGIYASGSTNFEKETLMGRTGANEVFINDFIDFRKKLPSMISSNFFVGKPESKDKFIQYFTSYNFTQKEVFELYLVTNGELNKDKYNDFQETLVFSKVFEMMGASSLRGETYTYAIKDMIVGGPSFIDKVPEGFRNKIWEAVKKGGESAIGKLGGFMAELWGALDTKERGYAVGGTILFIAATIMLGRVALIGKSVGIGFIGGLGIYTIGELYSYLSKNENTQKVLAKNNIKSADDLEKKFESIKSNV